MLTIALAPVIVVWAYAVIEIYALAHRRGRRGVRAGALRARAALVIGTLFAGAAAGAAVVLAGAGRAVPLLALPAAAVIRLSLPRLSQVIQRLYADPWGPSDPPVRRAVADPALTVPVEVALLGVLVAGFPPTWPVAAATYAFVAVAAVGMTLDGRRRLARLARLRTGMVARVLVRSPVHPLLTEPKPVGRTRFTSGASGRRPGGPADGPAGRRPCPYRTNATQKSPAIS